MTGADHGCAHDLHVSRAGFIKDRKGGDLAEWPEDLRVREWPEMRT